MWNGKDDKMAVLEKKRESSSLETVKWLND